jgi:DNA-binding IclR family transcriptional regulator
MMELSAEDGEGGGAMAASVGTQAVDRASAVLTTVLASTDPVTFADLAASTGLPKSTLSRLTTSLERNGLLQRTAAGTWQPGAAITDYALSVRPEDDLLRMAQPFLDALGTATGETVNLAVPVGGEVRQIAQVDSTYLLGAVNWLDRPVPFHCSALGRVFLAYGTPVPPGRLPRLTERTITSRPELAEALDKVRREGVAVVDSELEPGLVAVAAPIRSADDSVVAAVSVSGPSVRLTASEIPLVARAVRATADQISEALTTARSDDLRKAENPRKAGAA